MGPKPNGFFMFTLEWKSLNGKNMNMKEAIAMASKIWQNMNEPQRRPYNERAKQSKKFKPAQKLTCTGQPVQHILNQQAELEEQKLERKRNIECIVRNSVDNDAIDKQSYLFIMVNYFTRKSSDGAYVPAELSISEYSLGRGISRVYHTLINPGDVLYGNTAFAKDLAKTSHQLPLPPNAKGQTDMRSVFNDVLQFVQDAEGNVNRPLFTLSSTIEIVESVLTYLSDYHENDSIRWKVYPIEHLFFVLKEATCRVGEQPMPSSHHITNSYFDRDFFEYQSGISCAYHEEIDKTKYCTQSYVTRWGYMFSDYMCKDIGIVPIPGRHIPQHLQSVMLGGESVGHDFHSVVDSERSRGGFHYKNQIDSPTVSDAGVSGNVDRRNTAAAANAYKEIKPGQPGFWRKKKMPIPADELACGGANDDDDTDDPVRSSSVGGWHTVESTPSRPNTYSFDFTCNSEEFSYDRDFPPVANGRNRRDLTYNLPNNKKTNGRNARK